MDHRVKDILNRIEKTSPPNPGSMAKTLCGSDESLLAEVLHALCDIATRKASHGSRYRPIPRPRLRLKKTSTRIR